MKSNLKSMLAFQKDNKLKLNTNIMERTVIQAELLIQQLKTMRMKILI